MVRTENVRRVFAVFDPQKHRLGAIREALGMDRNNGFLNSHALLFLCPITVISGTYEWVGSCLVGSTRFIWALLFSLRKAV